MNDGVRPPGVPTYGFTESGKIVKLSGKTVPGFDPVTCVTCEGWDGWYPVAKSEYLTREKKPPRGRSKVKSIDLWEGIEDDGEGTEGMGVYWRFRP